MTAEYETTTFASAFDDQRSKQICHFAHLLRNATRLHLISSYGTREPPSLFRAPFTQHASLLDFLRHKVRISINFHLFDGRPDLAHTSRHRCRSPVGPT